MSLITYLTQIRFAPGAITGLSDDLSELGVTRPLIVSDRGVAAAGLVDRLRESASALRDAPLFADVPTNPTEEAVSAALEVYAANGCDGIVALGGGSPIDLAKGVALLATHPGPLAQYAMILGGLPKITSAVAPVIAIPTTAGTGSEVGRGALITLADGRKLGFISAHLIPRRAVCDPDLTVGMPAWLTAATGMDALTHCFETYLSPRDNPPAEAIALDGLCRAFASLEAAVADGRDAGARREMLMASLMGGLTFQKGLGAVHALSHPLGGYRELALHHGTLNAVLLPHVLRFNETTAPEKYATICARLGLAPNADLAQTVHDLVGRIHLPRTLKAMGVPARILPDVAKAALLDHSHASNPRKASEQDYLDLLNAAM